ncbi:MAG: RHS repeat-associated core domain-containing protein, partial [Coriobacteriia bacterium]
AETGLFYLPARYYDPATYRFLSQDPAAPSAGDPLSLNAYAYCLGDPVDYTDPSGATVDVDGDGKHDAEDSITENYIQTPDGPLKDARRAGMWAATSVALDPHADAKAVAMAARRNFEAARANPHFAQMSVDWYGDFNVSVCGVTVGLISNYSSGWYRLGESSLQSRYFYFGSAQGSPPLSVSKMTGRGRTLPGVYVEDVGGAVFGAASGLGLTNHGLTAYVQDGMSSPQAGLSAFYVTPWNLK